MQNSPPPLKAGQQVSIRRGRWQILDVYPFDGCALLTVVSSERPSSPAATRHFLVPFDDVETLVRARRPRFVRAAPWRRACRALLAADTPPGSLQSIRGADIDVMPHQLEPVLAILCGLGARLLIADEVGLGKTIQAAIVVSELLWRGHAERVLVLVPSGLRWQWAAEFAARFGIEAHVASAAALRRQMAALPVGVNPWLMERVAVASIDYVKRPEVLAAVAAVRWDIVIVDEAHASAGDSDRRGAVDALASRAPYVLLLTATPHNGDRRAFVSLCDLGGVGDNGRLLVFRRTRASIRTAAVRCVHSLFVRPSRDETRMHAMLAAYTGAICAERSDAWLAMAVLHKRALSGAWALARSVERRLEALARPDREPAAAEQMLLPLWDRDGEYSHADDVPMWPVGVGLADAERDARMLRALLACARAASARESKLAALHRLLRRAKEPAVVFTEYRDTLVHVQRALDRPATVLHGGLTADERSRALEDFAAGRRSVLLATDAGGEGLNLHHASRLVVNLELPWNPMRLEQRIGRVDRIGQRKRVHAFHLIAAGTGETRIAERLRSRIAQAHADLAGNGGFGAEEERTIAQLAILGAAPDDAPTESAGLSAAADGARTDGANLSTAGSGTPTERVSPLDVALHFPDLDSEARREADRLASVRTLTSGAITLDEHQVAERGVLAMSARAPFGIEPYLSGPLIWRTRRAVLRAALGRNALLIWRVRCEDGSGRIVDTTLVPARVAIDSSASLRTCKAIERWLTGVEESTRSVVLSATAEWRGLVHERRAALLAARRAREEAIRAVAAQHGGLMFQPGLFDRRAERRRLIAAAALHSEEAEHRHRLDALERAETVGASEAELVLVVVPRQL
jgi:superfamily II DNA or RNA helicase